MTNCLSPSDLLCRFEDFYRLYQSKPGEFKYQEQINEILSKNENTLIVRLEDLSSFDPYMIEISNVPDSLNAALDAFKNLLRFQGGLGLLQKNYSVCIINKTNKTKIDFAINIEAFGLICEGDYSYTNLSHDNILDIMEKPDSYSEIMKLLFEKLDKIIDFIIVKLGKIQEESPIIEIIKNLGNINNVKSINETFTMLNKILVKTVNLTNLTS